MGCTRLNWAALGCTGLYMALLGCTLLYWAVVGFTELYGRYWAVPGGPRDPGVPCVPGDLRGQVHP